MRRRLVSRIPGWAVATVVFVAAIVRSLADGIGLVDESWFLQVIARMRAGDVLYRDVFLGVTPLSAYLTFAATWLTGVDLLAVKLVANLAFAAATWLAWWMARQASGAAAASFVAAILVVLARPYPSAPYTPVAVVFFMAVCAVATTQARRARERGPTLDAWMGVFAGLAFLSKQNVGLLALAAAVASIALARTIILAARARAAVRVSAAALATIAIGLVPTLATGGWPMLLDYGFTNKGAYLVYGRVSYVASLVAWLGAAALPWSAASLNELVRGVVLVLPVIVAVIGLLRWRRKALDVADWPLIVFSGAATLIALPRWNRYHMAHAVPMLVTALVTLACRPRDAASPISPRLRAALAASFPIAAVVALAPGILAISTESFSSVPHFRGALTTAAADESLRQSIQGLQQAAGGRSMFVLDPRAGFLYLATGLRNPTPFDFPAVTSVGLHGAERLRRDLADGTLPQVCVGHNREGLYYFEPVVSYVTAHFEPGEETGMCRMYRAR